jgi:hypothetical protein
LFISESAARGGVERPGVRVIGAHESACTGFVLDCGESRLLLGELLPAHLGLELVERRDSFEPLRVFALGGSTVVLFSAAATSR